MKHGGPQDIAEGLVLVVIVGIVMGWMFSVAISYTYACVHCTGLHAGGGSCLQEDFQLCRI